ncbi:MAG: asparagine synthase (glutamine-hydrolyzing) [Gammaproteobacteria bacterium]|nr:MAG: asparagine synthase (glutamine-hydrolyzing) [Gammaproteobacteria bacterium]
MCGITGAIYSPTVKAADFASELSASIESIHHRGPDSNGSLFFENTMLGHVRLSILDLSNAGHQPMESKSKRFVISYNGEVYNFKALAKKYNLTDLKSGSDTEVILELFEQYGPSIVSEFNGMFAFSIIDCLEKKMWLVRDRTGIKPLYINTINNCIFFASEIKAIKKLINNKTLTLNTSKVHEWLYYGSALGAQTLYGGINKLLPGHYLEIDINTLNVNDTCYWKPTAPSYNTANVEHLISKNTALLEQAVQRQLVSDVPVGVFLSGGIDSSAIAAFASKHYDKKLSTYTAGFDFSEGVNELAKAKKLADALGTEHHEIHISGVDVADIVEKMVEHHDQPFSDAANIPLYLLCEKVKNTTKVVLQGDGGDELYGGYKRYHTLGNINKMKWAAGLGNVANMLAPKNKQYHTRQRYINALKSNEQWKLMALLLTVEDEKAHPESIFKNNFRKQVLQYSPFERYKTCQSQFEHCKLSDQMALIDSQIILPDIFLEKVDKSTMAASVEVRVPFLDNDLIAFTQSIPSSIKIPKGHQKWLLKKSLAGIVPDDVLYGKKMGFGVPYGFWVAHSLKALFFDNLAKFNEKYPNVLDVNYIETIHKIHIEKERDFGFLLWKILNFTLWANKSHVGIS